MAHGWVALLNPLTPGSHTIELTAPTPRRYDHDDDRCHAGPLAAPATGTVTAPECLHPGASPIAPVARRLHLQRHLLARLHCRSRRRRREALEPTATIPDFLPILVSDSPENSSPLPPKLRGSLSSPFPSCSSSAFKTLADPKCADGCPGGQRAQDDLRNSRFRPGRVDGGTGRVTS